jgi:hypothetical protein
VKKYLFRVAIVWHCPIFADNIISTVKMNRIKIFVILLFLVACSDQKEENLLGDVYGDVFIKATLKGEETTYAPVFYSYSNQQMVSSYIYHSDKIEQKLMLDSLDFGYTFARFPIEDDFSENKPMKGQYFFKAVYRNGHESLASDYLTEEVIAVSQISSVIYDSELRKVTIAWSSDEKASNHKLLLVRPDGVIVYESQLLDKRENSITIESNSLGWYSNNKPDKTATISIVLNSYLFEPAASPFDLQCLAVNDKESFSWEN